MVDTCLFCDIVSRKIEAEIVLDEPEVLAFLDHRPLFKGHVLVVPKSHYDNIFDCPSELFKTTMDASQRLASGVRSAMDADGIFLAINNEISQSVPHLHIHVVPRKRKDGLRGFMWPRGKYAADEAAAVGARIREAMQ